MAESTFHTSKFMKEYGFGEKEQDFIALTPKIAEKIGEVGGVLSGINTTVFTEGKIKDVNLVTPDFIGLMEEPSTSKSSEEGETPTVVSSGTTSGSSTGTVVSGGTKAEPSDEGTKDEGKTPEGKTTEEGEAGTEE